MFAFNAVTVVGGVMQIGVAVHGEVMFLTPFDDVGLEVGAVGDFKAF